MSLIDEIRKQGAMKKGTIHNHAIGSLKEAAAQGYAQFNVKVTQVKNDYTGTVYAPIFGYLFMLTGYHSQGFDGLSGVTSGIFNSGEGASSSWTNRDKTVISYGVTDTDYTPAAITIESSSAMPYPSFVAATVSDVFQCAGIRYTLDSANNLTQYSNDIVVKKETLFGADESNRITPQSYVNPEQFQNNVVDLPVPFAIDKSTMIYTQLIVTGKRMIAV